MMEAGAAEPDTQVTGRPDWLAGWLETCCEAPRAHKGQQGPGHRSFLTCSSAYACATSTQPASITSGTRSHAGKVPTECICSLYQSYTGDIIPGRRPRAPDGFNPCRVFARVAESRYTTGVLGTVTQGKHMMKRMTMIY